MKKTTAALVALALLFIGLIVIDNLVDWAWYWKLLVALGPAIVPLLFIAKTPTTTYPGTPAARSNSPSALLDQIVTSILSIMFAAAIIYGGYLAISSLWYWSTGGKTVLDHPQIEVVNNGFPRHDAKYPPSKTERSFKKTLAAGETSAVLDVKEGDLIRIYRLDKPIRLRVKHPEVDGWDTITKPGRLRLEKSGTVEIFSPTGPNSIEIGRAW